MVWPGLGSLGLHFVLRFKLNIYIYIYIWFGGWFSLVWLRLVAVGGLVSWILFKTS